jgi:hypothetical protein
MGMQIQARTLYSGRDRREAMLGAAEVDFPIQRFSDVITPQKPRDVVTVYRN